MRSKKCNNSNRFSVLNIEEIIDEPHRETESNPLSSNSVHSVRVAHTPKKKMRERRLLEVEVVEVRLDKSLGHDHM